MRRVDAKALATNGVAMNVGIAIENGGGDLGAKTR